MIRPLRRRHRVFVSTLGVVVPLAFVAGIAARKPVPVAATVASELIGSGQDFGRIVWTRADIWPGQPIITRLRRDSAGAAAVELAFGDLVKPDVLVYWAAGMDPAINGLPQNARFLGALSNSAPLPVATDMRGESGRFILYSLADHDVVAASIAFIIQKD